MIIAPALWSIAGVLTRHLDSARGFEITFWCSLFSAIFVAGALLYRQGAGEVPAQETLIGGAVVMAARVFNELAPARTRQFS